MLKGLYMDYPDNLVKDIIGNYSKWERPEDIDGTIVYCLNCLGDIEKGIVLLKYKYGYTIDTIAKELKMSRNAVIKTLKTARITLKAPYYRRLILCGLKKCGIE